MGSTRLDGNPAHGGGRVEGGQQGQGRERLGTHCWLCADLSGRSTSCSRCKDRVTHPEGTAHRPGGALHRSSERHPQTHLQL